MLESDAGSWSAQLFAKEFWISKLSKLILGENISKPLTEYIKKSLLAIRHWNGREKQHKVQNRKHTQRRETHTKQTVNNIRQIEIFVGGFAHVEFHFVLKYIELCLEILKTLFNLVLIDPSAQSLWVFHAKEEKKYRKLHSNLKIRQKFRKSQIIIFLHIFLFLLFHSFQHFYLFNIWTLCWRFSLPSLNFQFLSAFFGSRSEPIECLSSACYRYE